MARRSREAIQKRQRERKRAEKAAIKRQKRLERKQGPDELEAAEGDEPEGEEGGSDEVEGDEESSLTPPEPAP